MNKKLFVLAALLFLMISICTVSAENINQTDDNMKIYDSDTLSGEESGAGSFSDLSNELTRVLAN